VAAVHDLQRQTSFRDQNASGLVQDLLVLLLRVEEPEGIQQDGSVHAGGMKRQPSHVTPNPLRMNARIRGKAPRALEQGCRRVDPDDFSPKLCQGQRVPPMTAADVGDARTRCQA